MSRKPHLRKFRLKCQYPPCGQMFESYTKDQKTCSPSHGIKNRGPAWFKAHAAKIALIRQANGYSRFIKRMRAANMTDAQIAVVRKEVLMTRSNAFTAGKRKGWQEALGEVGDDEKSVA